MSVISSISENLADGVAINPKRLTEYGSLIREQSRRLGRMVESILMVSGLNRGEVSQAEWASTNIAAAIDDVARMLETTAESAGMEIRCEIHTDSAEFFYRPHRPQVDTRKSIDECDPSRTVTGREYECRNNRRRIATDLDPESRWFQSRRLIIWVEDEGPGIPHREQKHVFDAFYRGAATRKIKRRVRALGFTW